MNRFIVTAGCLCLGLAVAAPSFARDFYENIEGYKGYKERPYDKKRHYEHREYHNHRYNYRGHWRSWDEWDRYAEKHPDVRKHGRYYYDGPHLMFRTCPPETNTCIFFSIGR